MKSIGLYCHIPFCVRKCAYCDFTSFSHWDEGIVERYFDLLKKEIILFKEKSSYQKEQTLVDTIYFGGGTPSAVPSDYIIETMNFIKEHFLMAENPEVTIEINPGTLTLKKAEDYFGVGFNRVSMGLQAWQDKILKKIGRIHCQGDFIESMGYLKKAGFRNISVDLMYGLPSQEIDDVLDTLEAVMSFSPNHLSCYSLILEEGTPMTKAEAAGKSFLPSEDEERQMHWIVNDYLKEVGYEHYEISSYSKPGFQSRHNLKYWEEVPYLGFGMGAYSFYNNCRYGNPSNFEEYERLITEQLNHRDYERLTPEEVMKEWVFLGLRKLKGISRKDFQDRFNQELFTKYKNEINPLIDEGLLVIEGDFLRLTAKGQDYGNLVFMTFL